MILEKYKFKELSLTNLYEILRLRTAVFVIEQNCPYQECDNLDQDAIHYLIKKQDRIIAYLRVIFENDTLVKIGRVVVEKTERKNGYGIHIMNTAINDFKKQYPNRTLKISAQQYLDTFYSNLGFKKNGKKYLEDGIPHQEMVLD